MSKYPSGMQAQQSSGSGSILGASQSIMSSGLGPSQSVPPQMGGASYSKYAGNAFSNAGGGIVGGGSGIGG